MDASANFTADDYDFSDEKIERYINKFQFKKFTEFQVLKCLDRK